MIETFRPAAKRAAGVVGPDEFAREVLLKRNVIVSILILVGLSGLASCQSRENAATSETATISPATPPQSTDAETPVTQTVEIGEERSPNEGGILTDPDLQGSPAVPATSPSPSPASQTPQ
jgi:hypothetical protein